MVSKACSLAPSKLIFKQLVINSLIVLMLLFPLLACSDQNDSTLAYHRLVSRMFPELDSAIFETLELSGISDIESDLKGITKETYRKWHLKIQTITNSPVSSNAKLLAELLPPNGFNLIAKNHFYELPEQDGFSEVEFVIHYFLQIVGTMIKKNPSLRPLQEDLIELFQCNNRDCKKLASITEQEDNPLLASDELKLQLFIECTQRTMNFSVEKKIVSVMPF